MTQLPDWDDYRWLTGDDARLWLQRAEGDQSSLLALTRLLRAELGSARAHLVLETVDLRRRARVKFSHADAMFFTRKLLEQATDEAVAAYKARRFPERQPLADLCCGIGGDLLGLARRAEATGVDRDRLALLYAEANCRALGLGAARVRQADVESCDLAGLAAWHLDPDRRPAGRRATRVECHAPGVQAIAGLLRCNGNAAIKLAPAAAVPQDWAETGEVEWIESRGECRQQVVWLGTLTQTPGQRRATRVDPPHGPPCSVQGTAGLAIPTAKVIGRYLYEPGAAVLASRLTGALATTHRLSAITPGIAYLTGDGLITDPLLAAFEVLAVLPFDVKRVKGMLRERGIGRLEVKKRGVPLEPDHVLRKLKPLGPHARTLILLPRDRAVIAVLARRVDGTGLC